MPKQYISYEMEAMFVGPSGAMQTPGNASGVAKLDFIQSYGFSFNVERQALKQIGSSSFASRQTQLAPDVDLDVEYYLNRGWNEKFIGMDVGTSSDGYKNPFSGIFTYNQDRNFYVLISEKNASDINAETNYDSYNVLGIGNAYLTNFELNIAVNALATVGLSFVAANAEISKVSSSTFQNPALYLTGSGSQVLANQSVNVIDNNRFSRYITGYRSLFDGGCPHGGCLVSASPQIGEAVKFGFDFDNFQSLSISIPFERKALYGFGNNYPFHRKILKPVIGTLSIDSLVDTLNAENLASTFEAEDVTVSGYNFDIRFSNLSGASKFGIKINNARLDSYSIGNAIGDRSIVSTSWSFEINESTGILISGSYAPPVASSTYITEAINL